jgi:hypothetical protein
MTPSMDTETTTPVEVPPELREALCPLADELEIIKGQLTDLPVISERLASTRLDLRHDVRELRAQVAELPGIRARQDEHGRRLAEISTQLATIIELLTGEKTPVRDEPEPGADSPVGA